MAAVSPAMHFSTTLNRYQQVVSQAEYLPLRVALLEKEKELTRLRDDLNKQRKALPLVALDKQYIFVDSESNEKLPLKDLFGDRRQLIIYHAMFGPDDKLACESCTFLMDHIPDLSHLRSHDTNLVVVSRARPEQIKEYKQKMGFDGFRWVSAYESDFNYDFHVTMDYERNQEYNFRSVEEWKKKQPDFGAPGETPGLSVFVLGGDRSEGGIGRGGEAGKVYYAYSAYARGGEEVITTVKWLDFTPLGRQDGELKGAKGVGFKRRYEYTPEDIGTMH